MKAINNKKSVDHFDKLAVQHNTNYASVLDASDNENATHSNTIHDYFSKKFVKNYTKINKNSVVLDFGCGVGRLTQYFQPKVKKIYGTDASTKMMEVARVKNIDKKISYIDSLDEIPEKSLDIVFTNWVLAHIEDESIVQTFIQLKNKLNDNARICIFEQVPANEDKKMQNEVYYRRSIKEYEIIFEKAGYKLTKSKLIYRQPSYARAIWNKLPSSFSFLLPLLYFVEKKTLFR